MVAVAKRADGLKAGDSFRDFRGHLCTVRDDLTLDVSIVDFDESMTEECHAEECSLEYIVNKYHRSEVPIQMPESEYQDFLTMPDFQTLMNSKQRFETAWAEMPIHVKKAFKNDPAAFLDALQDPSQKDLFVELGVLNNSSKSLEGATFEVADSSAQVSATKDKKAHEVS